MLFFSCGSTTSMFWSYLPPTWITWHRNTNREAPKTNADPTPKQIRIPELPKPNPRLSNCLTACIMKNHPQCSLLKCHFAIIFFFSISSAHLDLLLILETRNWYVLIAVRCHVPNAYYRWVEKLRITELHSTDLLSFCTYWLISYLLKSRSFIT